jgi:hypothetical protein
LPVPVEPVINVGASEIAIFGAKRRNATIAALEPKMSAAESAIERLPSKAATG